MAKTDDRPLVFDGEVQRPMTDEEFADLQRLQAISAQATDATDTAAENEQTIRGQAEAAVVTLENAVAGWASLTAPQKDAALKLTVRVVAKLARLVLGKLDSAGA